MLYNTFSSQKKVKFPQRNNSTVITRYNKQERSMTRRVFSEYADTAWTYGGDRPQDMQRSTDDWQTKSRGALADEYEIYVDCTTDPTPLTYDEWLNT